MRELEPDADADRAGALVCDAVLVNGHDASAAHRAHVRALNTARQSAEAAGHVDAIRAAITAATQRGRQSP